MPITFSVTCDTDEELARFLENVRFAQELKTSPKKASATPAAATQTKEAPVKKQPKAVVKSTKKAPAKKAAPTKAKAVKSVTKAAPKKAAPKKATVKKTASKPVKTAKSVKLASVTKKKPGVLSPIIDKAIREMVGKGKPFRSRDVTELVMKKSPSLNESSVTTGVSKQLNESSLKWEQIKDAVGRPYKLYKP